MNDQIRLENLTTGYRGGELLSRSAVKAMTGREGRPRPVQQAITTDINATLAPGQLTCLLGPNGAGKSTLLKTLCAFIPPLQGRILIDGKDINQYRARALARIIGVVLTERPTAMNMTVAELVAIGRSPYTSFLGGMKAEDAAIVAESIRLVGIEHLADRPVHTLSDGERQKAFIAKALAQQTRIILLDEPTAFLDYPSKVEIMKLLLRIAREEGKIIFMSTHDIELALQIADMLWLLDREHGLHIGTPQQLAADGTFATYFERPGLNFIPDTMSFKIEKSCGL